MNVDVEKKFAVEVVYNGISKSLTVQPDEHIRVLLQRAIAAFGITQNQHLLAIFRENGTEVPDNETVEQAHLKHGEVLLLRPSAVRGGCGTLRLAEGLLAETFRTLRTCGLGMCECVAYWTGPSGALVVDGVEHPIHRRSPVCYEVDSTWLTEFWKQLAITGRSIKAQLHTHPGRAFHSETDDEWPIVSQPGFLSIVIPNFASGEASLDYAWVGCLQSDGKWQRLGCASEVLILS